MSKDSLAISKKLELFSSLFGSTKVKSKHNNEIASWLSSTKKFQASFWCFDDIIFLIKERELRITPDFYSPAIIINNKCVYKIALHSSLEAL